MTSYISSLRKVYSDNDTMAYFIFYDLILFSFPQKITYNYPMNFNFICLSGGEDSWVQIG